MAPPDAGGDWEAPVKLGGPWQHREQGPEGKLWADEEECDLLTRFYSVETGS